jgi:hypothetical protein
MKQKKVGQAVNEKRKRETEEPGDSHRKKHFPIEVNMLFKKKI